MSEIFKIDDKTWRIEDSGVRFFLLEGNECAMMIDTGMNTPNAREIGEGLTDKPIKLINTHADPDHISGNQAFAEFYMSDAERGNYEAHGGIGTICPVKDGDVIDLGDRPLLIWELPGHTPGSIAILDVNARTLYGGDAIQDGRIFMFGERRNILLYMESLTALWKAHKDEFDNVYPSHSNFPVNPAIIPQLIEAATTIRDGNAIGERISMWGNEIMYYNMGCAGFLCDIVE